MKFNATRNQLLCIMANAVNASTPMGLGFLQYQNKAYNVQDMEPYVIDSERIFADLDYVDGRMVKLTIFKEEGQYVIRDDFRADYQSFVNLYPTVEALIKSAGI